MAMQAIHSELFKVLYVLCKILNAMLNNIRIKLASPESICPDYTLLKQSGLSKVSSFTICSRLLWLSTPYDGPK